MDKQVESGLTWAEKFRILRETLNWPAKHMMEYIDAGYKKNTYHKYMDIENGKDEPSDYLLQWMCETFYVNYEWMTEGKGPIILKNSRIRSDEQGIRCRANRKSVSRSLSGAKRIADQLDIGLEYLLCGDMMAKEFPVNQGMIDYTRYGKDPE